MELLNNEQRDILETINPDYEKMDKFELVELIENEINKKGITKDSFNEYGLILDKIIDLLIFNNKNILYIYN